MIIGDRDSVVGNYRATGARHLAPSQLVVHGLDPHCVDPAEGAANVADDVLQLRREQVVGRGVVRHARARLAADVAIPEHCA